MELKIEQTVLDKAVNDSFSKLIAEDNYGNPVKKILENEFQWDLSGEGKTEFAKEFKKKVQQSMQIIIDDPDFHQTLGRIIANKFAEVCVKDLRTLKELKKGY